MVTSEKTPPAPTPDGAIVAGLAKWLVPSVSILFAAAGYVVVAAHNDLLGVPQEGYGFPDYIAAAAAFLQDVLTTISDAVLNALTFVDAPHFAGIEVALTAVLTLSCILLAIPAVNRFHVDQRVLAALLLAFVFATFVIMDAPLSRISDVLVAPRSGSTVVAGELPIEQNLTELSPRKGLERFIDARARTLWTHMVCARLNSSDLTRGGKTPRVDCEADERARGKSARDRLVRGAFFAHLMVSLLLLVLSVQTLRRAKDTLLFSLSVLTLFYSLTLPYAYGKLIKPTYCEFGTILFKSPMANSPSTPETRMIDGFVLYRNTNTSTLLTSKAIWCPPPKNGVEEKLWEVPNKTILAIQEIYWDDVITWAIQHRQQCM